MVNHAKRVHHRDHFALRCPESNCSLQSDVMAAQNRGIDMPTTDGLTPLMLAASHNRPDVIVTLISVGANP